MNDMSQVIIPKSDQISADDLIAGPITIRIAEVTIRPGTEQPVSIHFDGDQGRPWKPCKSMSRCLVAAWGADANKYVGRSATLYRDPTVKWGGMEVGGIRISHLSHIDKSMVLALTATKGSRKPFTVKPLVVDSPKQSGDAIPAALKLFAPDGKEVSVKSIGTWVSACEKAIAAMENAAALVKWRTDMAPNFLAAESVDIGAVDHVQGRAQDRLDELADQEGATA